MFDPATRPVSNLGRRYYFCSLLLLAFLSNNESRSHVCALQGSFFGFHGQRIPDFKSNRECMECHVATSELDLYIWVVMIIGFYRYSFNFTCIYIYLIITFACIHHCDSKFEDASPSLSDLVDHH